SALSEASTLPVETSPLRTWANRQPFLIRLMNWEYWPAFLVNIPVVMFWLIHAVKARALFFFSAANPSIETGGVMGESKIAILDQVPAEFKPKTVFVPHTTSAEAVEEMRMAAGLEYPIIAKPNVGERGLLVEKIADQVQLAHYASEIGADYLLQNFVTEPLEVSVLHYRMPDADKGIITSFCLKEHLKVRGNGKDNLRELIHAYPRALLQWPALEEKLAGRLNEVPAKDEIVELVPIGNHSRGAMFLDANDLIDDQLHEVFDDLSNGLEGIYFCRYDLKCESLESLRAKRDFKILEINGVAAEPAHIYDPTNSLMHAYKAMWQQWKAIYRVATAVHRQQGVPYMTWREAWDSLRKYQRYMKNSKNWRI
ncbi:MAG: hypothetical protein AAF206_25375, partial [Bacteroidota bacterium]